MQISEEAESDLISVLDISLKATLINLNSVVLLVSPMCAFVRVVCLFSFCFYFSDYHRAIHRCQCAYMLLRFTQ